MTARTASQIADSITKNISGVDNSIETRFGPVRDIVINPVSSELEYAETQADYVANLYSHDFISKATQVETDVYLRNMGMVSTSGKKATTILQSFFRYTAPKTGDTWTVPEGTLIGNSNQTLLYRTTSTVTMTGTNALTYYNSSKRRYEIFAPAESIAVGSQYNLPIARVTSIVSTVSGFDGTENSDVYAGGEDQGSSSASFAKIQNRFAGLDKGSYGGLLSQIENIDPAIVSVSVIPPSNPLFTRYTIRPALDIYLSGATLVNFEDSFTVSNPAANSFVLTKPPVANITAVVRNGETLSTTAWTFYPDTGKNTGYSYYANDTVSVTGITLVQGDVVVIRYQYNKLIRNIQETKFSDSNALVFGLDGLVRQNFWHPIKINYSFKALASANLSLTKTAIESTLAVLVNVQTFLNPNVNNNVLRPGSIKTALLGMVSDLVSFDFVVFQSLSSANSTIESIVIAENELPIIDVNNLKNIQG